MQEGGVSRSMMILASIAFAAILTNLASNTAIASMAGGLALAAAPSFGMNTAGLVICVCVASSLAFSLPSATPPIAIVFASGEVRIGTLAKGGVVLLLIMIFVMWLVGLPIYDWVFPLVE